MSQIPYPTINTSARGVPPPAVKPNYTPWYIACLIGVFAILVIGVLGITIIRPTEDNTQLIGTFVSIGLIAIPALITLIKSAENGEATRIYHEAVNSKMDAWIKAAEDVARSQEAARGQAVQDEQRKTIDALAQKPAVLLPAGVAPVTPPALTAESATSANTDAEGNVQLEAPISISVSAPETPVKKVKKK